MQTFLPYPSFTETAKCLDYRRLGKQRVEAMMILRIIAGETPNSRWRNHPAVKMWRGHEEALKDYMNEMIREWIRRGYKNTMKITPAKPYILPPFICGPIHATHRAALLAKNYDYYSQFGWTEEPKIEYVWG